MYNFYRNYGKRAFDILIAIIAIPVVLPISLIIVFFIAIMVGFPILFRQDRPGYKEKPFVMIKFRTMNEKRDKSGELLPDGQRLTYLGRMLRRTSLDELPELFNVLKGDMSIVGPRPLLIRYLPYYSKEEKARFDVLPGITGISQIEGRNDLCWDKRMALDIKYVKQYSFLLDIKIIFLSIWKVVKGSGVHVDSRRTMLDFDEERRALNEDRREEKILK